MKDTTVDEVIDFGFALGVFGDCSREEVPSFIRSMDAKDMLTLMIGLYGRYQQALSDRPKHNAVPVDVC